MLHPQSQVHGYIHSMQATMHYLVTFLKQDEVAGYSCVILGELAHAWWNASI